MRKDPMTIRDYLARLEPFKDQPQRFKTTPIPPDAVGDPFTRLLTSSLARIDRKTGPGAKGLTAEDYLANPLPSGYYDPINVYRFSPQITPDEAATGRKNRTFLQNVPLPALSKTALARRGQAVTGPSKPQPNRGPVHRDDTTAQTIDNCIRESAEKYGMPPELIRAVVKAESNFKVDAVSVAGAQGLMQLMPGTARELGVTDPFDIRQNIDGGTRYLRQMLDLFGGDIRKALSAYNAGPGNVIKYDGEVPFPETQRYISRILNTARTAA